MTVLSIQQGAVFRGATSSDFVPALAESPDMQAVFRPNSGHYSNIALFRTSCMSYRFPGTWQEPSMDDTTEQSSKARLGIVGLR